MDTTWARIVGVGGLCLFFLGGRQFMAVDLRDCTASGIHMRAPELRGEFMYGVKGQWAERIKLWL